MPTGHESWLQENLWFRRLLLWLPWSNVFSPAGGLILIALVITKNSWKVLNTPMNRFWLLLSGWMLLTTATAFDLGVALTGLCNFLPFFALTAISSYIVSTPKEMVQCTWCIVLSTLPISTFALLQVILNRPDWTLPRLFQSYILTLGKSPDGRITAFFGHFNELAMFLILSLPLCTYFLTQGNRRQRILSGVALSIGMGAIFFSGSRNAWGLLGVGSILAAAFYGLWWGVATIVGLGGLLAGAVWIPNLAVLRILFPAALIDRLSSTFDPKSVDFFSTASRWQVWQIASDLIHQRPWLGWGLRNFPIVVASLGKDVQHLPHEHNFFLTLAVGMGIPGLIAFLIAMGILLWTPTDRSPLRFAYKLGIGLYLLSGLLDVTFYEPRVNMLFWIMVGIVAASRNKILAIGADKLDASALE